MLQREGRRIVAKNFVLLARKREPVLQEAPARLGITVSRRVGNAVVRNRAKRVFREAFRATSSLWPKGCELLLIARSWPTGTGLTEIADQLHALAPALRRALERVRKSR